MSDVDIARKLSRLREVERRLAVVSVTAAASKLRDGDARIERLRLLSVAVAVPSGIVRGDAFAAGAECVSRLLAGCIVTTSQREHQIFAIETARGLFSVADARAGIAGRYLNDVERAHGKSAELKAALKMPVRGAPQCR